MKRKVIDAVVQLAVFLVLYLVSMNVLNDVYLLEWTARNKYLFIWVFVVIYIFANKRISAYALTIGNILGIIIGQLLGDYILRQNMGDMIPDIDPEIAYQLTTHYGAFIWMAVVFVFAILGPVIDMIQRRRFG